MSFVFADTMDDVLKAALRPAPGGHHTDTTKRVKPLKPAMKFKRATGKHPVPIALPPL